MGRGPHAARLCRADPRSRSVHPRTPPPSPARAHRLHPDADGRRDPARLHRLPRPAQPHPRSGEGGDTVPPPRRPRRDAGAGDVDDLEVRGGQHPLRRGEGRRGLRPEDDVVAGARAPDAPLRDRDRIVHRPHEGYPRPRRLHGRADHGLVHGHHQHDRGVERHQLGDRETDGDRRVARPPGGDRARGDAHRGGGAQVPGDPAGGGARRGPGVRQRGLGLGEAAPRGGREDRRLVGLQGGHLQPRRARPARGPPAQAANRFARCWRKSRLSSVWRSVPSARGLSKKSCRVPRSWLKPGRICSTCRTIPARRSGAMRW